MSDKYFLDTNIFVYTFDNTNPKKQATSQGLVESAINNNHGVISSQVIQEFLNVATRKFQVPLKAIDAEVYLKQIMSPICEIYPSSELYISTLLISAQTQYSFYDSLIIAAAIEANCKILYTEDMQHEQTIGKLRITNPFVH